VGRIRFNNAAAGSREQGQAVRQVQCARHLHTRRCAFALDRGCAQVRAVGPCAEHLLMHSCRGRSSLLAPGALGGQFILVPRPG
jgi:hypothetical protein